MTYTNSAHEESEIMFSVRTELHVLGAGDGFDLGTREPEAGSRQ